jgi:hypothetical protein
LWKSSRSVALSGGIRMRFDILLASISRLLLWSFHNHGVVVRHSRLIGFNDGGWRELRWAGMLPFLTRKVWKRKGRTTTLSPIRRFGQLEKHVICPLTTKISCVTFLIAGRNAHVDAGECLCHRRAAQNASPKPSCYEAHLFYVPLRAW